MASMNTRLNIEKLDGNIIQNHEGSKQVGLKQLGSKQVKFKQLGPGFETGFHGVQDEIRVWFEVELQGAQGNRATEDFWVSNDDVVVAQRQLEDKQLEEKTNTDCLVNKQVHHGANVGAFIMKTRVPGQEGTEGNAAERYRGDSNMAALGVAGVIEEYAHESLTFRDAVAYEAKQCDNNIYYWKYAPGLVVEAKEVILGMEMFRTQSGNTLRVTRFRFSNGMSIQILLGGHSTLSLEGGLLGNHDEEKKKSGFELRLVAGIATCALTKKKMKESMETNLGKLLKYNAWLTRCSPIRGDANIGSNGTIDFNRINYLNRVGHVQYSDAGPIWDSKSGKLSDFSTHFTFIIYTLAQSSYGHGLVFFLAPDGFNIPPNSAGGFLGILNQTYYDSPRNQRFFIEFDSFVNPEWDPPFEHVGINKNSISSVNYTEWNASMHSGDPIDVWVLYNATTYNFSVSWRYGSSKNTSLENTSISYNVDLREVLPEWVTIGFSAATGTNTEMHILQYWEFNSSLFMVKREENKSNKTKLIVGLTGSIGVVVVVGIAAACCVLFRRQTQDTNTLSKTVTWTSINEDLERGAARRFSYHDLALTTNNFSNDQKLGEGGLGCVYKGYLSHEGITVAVKKISQGSKQGKKEYITEVKINSSLRHRNLVQLIGLASALLYLHEDWKQCVVHRDIKPGNIMLDSEFNVKLGVLIDLNGFQHGDFGLARLMEHELGQHTTGLAGTLGYMAPEYITTAKASKESDVYSFGVVAFEIACGRRVTDRVDQSFNLGLVQWVWDLLGKGKLLSGVDKMLKNEYDVKQLECLIMVGLWCSHPDRRMRPSMRQAIKVLMFEDAIPILPMKMPVPMYYIPPADVPQDLVHGIDSVGLDLYVVTMEKGFTNGIGKTAALLPRCLEAMLENGHWMIRNILLCRGNGLYKPKKDVEKKKKSKSNVPPIEKVVNEREDQGFENEEQGRVCVEDDMDGEMRVRILTCRIGVKMVDLKIMVYVWRWVANGTIEFNIVNYLNRVGQAQYTDAVPIWDSNTGKLSDFTTHFTFTIDTRNNSLYGHGLVFFLAQVGFDIPPNSAGGFLGVLNLTNSDSHQNQMIFIEFDTLPTQNGILHLKNNSIGSANYTQWNASMHSGDPIDVWVLYNASTYILNVSWGYRLAENTSRENTSISYRVDLRDVLPEWVTIGFSATTGSNTERHVLHYWEFNSNFIPVKRDGNTSKKMKLTVGLTGSLGVVVVICIAAAFTIVFIKRQPDTNTILELVLWTSINEVLERGAAKRFSYNDLALATNNFSNDQKLGEGGFGCVYKGYLSHEGIAVAVLCQTAALILTSLAKKYFLFGLASALLYLHEEWKQCVVHRDIKPSNIMLDSEFKVKLGDFGLARVKWNMTGPTHNCFGVVALEIGCGRKARDRVDPNSHVGLVQWVWDLLGKGLWCAHPDRSLRPSVRQAIKVLLFEDAIPNLPMKMPVAIYYVAPDVPQGVFGLAYNSEVIMLLKGSDVSLTGCLARPPSLSFPHRSKFQNSRIIYKRRVTEELRTRWDSECEDESPPKPLT
ncbi:L-type lectin-domain containing receptor kinase IX.1-like protein [Tanacetum coccineum]